jgi:bacteriophage exclusion system BrxA-like protein
MLLSLYSATISSTSLLVRETRLVAELLLSGRGEGDAWQHAILEDNVLQSGSAVAVIRSANILRARLAPLGIKAWRFMRDGDQTLARQTALAGVIQHSRLVGDFLDLVVRDKRARFETHLKPSDWSTFLEGCRNRDPEMPEWSESTVNKLRSVVFTMLSEAAYLENTRTLRLQTVFVAPELSAFLEREGHHYVLRCMQVME